MHSAPKPPRRPPIAGDHPTLPGFADLGQVAVITADLAQTVADLSAALGAGSFKIVDLEAPALFETAWEGEPAPWSMRISVTWIGNTQLEVIQPLTGQTLFAEYLASRDGRAGVEHLFLSRGSISYEDAKAHFADAGCPMVQWAKMNADGRLGRVPVPALPGFLASRMATRFGYARGMDALKTDIELAKFPAGVTQRLALRAAIADSWYPVDDTEHFESAPDDAFIHDIDGFYVFTSDLNATAEAWGRLSDRAPQIRSYDDELLPGRGRVATLGLTTTTLHLVQPSDGAPRDILAARGEGVQLVQARTSGPLAQARERMLARGWEVTDGPGDALFGTHPRVPFALRVCPT